LPQIIPRSPDIASIETYSNIPSSESDVNIPLANLHIGSFALPISISYHKNGLKVDEIPSSVGDGWSLQYGGMISFQQNGLNDFNTSGLFDGGISSTSMTNLKFFLRGQMNTGQRWGYLERVISGNADAEFDQYHYSFSGRSGTYYYDTLMNAVTVPKTDLKIFRQANEIRILDNENNNYYFGAIEHASSADSSAEGYRPSFNDISAYYLSKIVTKENRTILFRYKSYSYTVTKNKSVIHFNSSCTTDNSVSAYTRTEQINYLLPDSIIFDQGFVKFSISTTFRKDIKTIQAAAVVPSITGLSIVNGNNNKIKEFSFVQGYFDTNKRLKLSGIQELNGTTLDKTWQFNYYHESAIFPAIFSNDQDHWGYYNASNNAGMIPNIDYSPLIPGWNNPAASYGNRSSDTAAVYGMLQSVIYPAGGSTAFEYESNQLRVGAYNELTALSPFLTVPGGTPVPYIIGGVRVKTIIINDSTGTPSRYRKYVYADSLHAVAFLNIPRYITNMQLNKNVAGACSPCGMQSVIFDESVVPFDGSPVTYSRVTVYDSSATGKQGKTENVYLLPLDKTASHADPYVAPVNTSWYAGKLLNQRIYSLTGNIYRLIREYRHTYTTLNKQQVTTGFKTNYAVYCELDSSTYNVSLSTLFSDRFFLLQSKKIDYLPNQGLTNQTNYTYNSATHTSPTLVTQLNSKAEKLNERTIYSFDYDTSVISSAEARGIRNLRRLNVLVPIEKIQYRTIAGIDYVTGATITTYREDRPFPDKIFQLNLNEPIPMVSYTTSAISTGSLVKDSRYETTTTFSRYDNNNNLTLVTPPNGIRVAYLYDYQQLYKVGEVLNATSDSVAYTSFETDQHGGWNYSGVPVTDPTSPTGQKCYNLATGSLSSVFTNHGDMCVLSYWTKNAVPFTFSGEFPYTPLKGRTVNGWTFFVHWVITVFTGNVTFPSSGYVDDVRLYPSKAQMKTYTYQPHTGITSTCDERGNITYYSYDATGRLKMVRDGDGKILKLIDYQYVKPITQ
jgi:YD repeat-containing protein